MFVCTRLPREPLHAPPPPPLTQGTDVDKKCPFTGNVAIRGRILKGIVTSTKMMRTIVLRRSYLRYITKYRRYEKRHKTLSAHCSPAFLVKDGDIVTVGQCRYVVGVVGRWGAGGGLGVCRRKSLTNSPPPPVSSPLSKTVRFNVLKVESVTEAGAMRAKKTFRVF